MTILPTDILVPEQSFQWRREDSKNIPVLEVITPDEDTAMVPAVINFIMFSIGGVTFNVVFAHSVPLYYHYLEGLIRAKEEDAEHLKKFIPSFGTEVSEHGYEYCILFGAGTQGIVDQRVLSFHDDEDEAIQEFKRVAEAIEHGDISVIVDREDSLPLLRLEEGTELLVSNTSSAGTGQISPN